MSAVCQYQIGDVKKVFEGSYKEYREASQKWARYSSTVPFPRPGSVSDWRPRTAPNLLLYNRGSNDLAEMGWVNNEGERGKERSTSGWHELVTAENSESLAPHEKLRT